MIEGIEKYYQKIAESIGNSIDGSWLRVVVEVIFYSEHIDFHCVYFLNQDAQSTDFFLNSDGRRIFRELRDIFKQANKPLWCKATFELSSDGKFKMNWGYDNCDENGFAKFDEEKDIKRIKER